MLGLDSILLLIYIFIVSSMLLLLITILELHSAPSKYPLGDRAFVTVLVLDVAFLLWLLLMKFCTLWSSRLYKRSSSAFKLASNT